MIPSEEDDETIGICPPTLEPFNADFDGDTVALYVIHDTEALQEMHDKAYIKNTVSYDANNDMLATIRHESLYAAYILTEYSKVDPTMVVTTFNSIQDLPESTENFNNGLKWPVNINGQIYPYGIALFNKWCGFNEIVITKTIDKHQNDYVSRTIYEYVKQNTEQYYDNLNSLSQKLLFFISTTRYCPSLNVDEMINMVDEDNQKLFDTLPNSNVELGYLINEAIIDKCLGQFKEESDLKRLYFSGSRFNRQQLARSCINVGYSADDNNIIARTPIKSNLMRGLTANDFFLGAPGSRKGIADKADATPKSGFLERTLAMALSPLEIVEEDCGGETYIEVEIFSKKHAKSLVGKYYKDPHDDNFGDWKMLDEETSIKYINNMILLRSPITCATPNFGMCRKCFGTKNLPTQYLGITAAQCLSERQTQLVMRSFHTSGSANLDISEINKQYIMENLLKIENKAENTRLYFKAGNVPKAMQSIPGYKRTKVTKDGENILFYNNIYDEIHNKDAISTMLKIKDLLKSQIKPNRHPAEYYSEMMSCLLEIGVPYSSFVEMLFANMFITYYDSKDKSTIRFWRYHQHEKIVRKLGDKTIAANLSPLLGLLYQPNARSLEAIASLSDLDLDNPTNIYERIWLGIFE